MVTYIDIKGDVLILPLEEIVRLDTFFAVIVLVHVDEDPHLNLCRFAGGSPCVIAINSGVCVI